MMEADFFVTIAQLEQFIADAKEATKHLGTNELFFRIYKPLTNCGGGGGANEEKCEYLVGRFDIDRERRKIQCLASIIEVKK